MELTFLRPRSNSPSSTRPPGRLWASGRQPHLHGRLLHEAIAERHVVIREAHGGLYDTEPVGGRQLLPAGIPDASSAMKRGEEAQNSSKLNILNGFHRNSIDFG